MILPNVPVVGVNRLGDLVCPRCKTNIITPSCMDVIPGTGTCPVCKVEFLVLDTQADEANFLTEARKCDVL